ncbi:hypothetical protein PAYE108092_01800 [Paracoccus yeei]
MPFVIMRVAATPPMKVAENARRFITIFDFLSKRRLVSLPG